MNTSRKMPAAIAIVTLALAGGVAADENEELAKTVTYLFERLTPKDSPITLQEGRVFAGGRRIEVKPVSETVLKNGGKFISAARFEISVDGTPQPVLTFGAIGVSNNTASEATDVAVMEWYMTAGQAVISAIGGKAGELALGEYACFPGLTGFRGPKPGGWLDATPRMHQQILSAVKQHLGDGDAAFRALNITIAVQENGNVEGKCTIDGEESAAVLGELKKFAWPSSKSDYVFKQAYVLRRSAKAGASPAPKE